MSRAVIDPALTNWAVVDAAREKHILHNLHTLQSLQLPGRGGVYAMSANYANSENSALARDVMSGFQCMLRALPEVPEPLEQLASRHPAAARYARQVLEGERYAMRVVMGRGAYRAEARWVAGVLNTDTAARMARQLLLATLGWSREVQLWHHGTLVDVVGLADVMPEVVAHAVNAVTSLGMSTARPSVDDVLWVLGEDTRVTAEEGENVRRVLHELTAQAGWAWRFEHGRLEATAPAAHGFAGTRRFRTTVTV